ncbi:hypothetical protein LuPra_06118 [Luteitalea pratensis]|uniref:Uncharacterized protein n=1 Tax=Luteitalea pratensis TaxID=1855912 RepID=A0A143PYC9_LUTPR|nr:hypothetical protein [Luteitalea pratensis]AMY12834.1 hypothetical protein LuPra_06118 [Luteitalea pratensis]
MPLRWIRVITRWVSSVRAWKVARTAIAPDESTDEYPRSTWSNPDGSTRALTM